MKAELKIQPVEWVIVESTPKDEFSLALQQGEHFYLAGMGDHQQDCLLSQVTPERVEILMADAILAPVVDGKQQLPLPKDLVIKIQTGESVRLETLTLDAGIIYSLTLEQVI